MSTNRREWRDRYDRSRCVPSVGEMSTLPLQEGYPVRQIVLASRAGEGQVSSELLRQKVAVRLKIALNEGLDGSHQG